MQNTLKTIETYVHLCMFLSHLRDAIILSAPLIKSPGSATSAVTIGQAIRTSMMKTMRLAKATVAMPMSMDIAWSTRLLRICLYTLI